MGSDSTSHERSTPGATPPPAKKPWTLDPVKEAAAVARLRESIAAVDPDDETLLLDSIEGETGFFEVVDALLRRMIANQAMITGLLCAESDLETRKARYQQRVATDRALIEQAMMIADLDKIERPVATLSLSARGSKVVIETESDIPSEFWKASDPTLDKKALADALKAGRTISGAVLSNAAPSLTARFK